VQLIVVTEAYEAPSLEEYLIRELRPHFNGTRRSPGGLSASI